MAQGEEMRRTRSQHIQQELMWVLHVLQETSIALYTHKTIYMNPYFDWRSREHAHREHVLAGLIIDLQEG